MWAAYKGHDAIFEMLMNKGAKLDLIDKVSELLTYYFHIFL
jgi:hypothetical protein